VDSTPVNFSKAIYLRICYLDQGNVAIMLLPQGDGESTACSA